MTRLALASRRRRIIAASPGESSANLSATLAKGAHVQVGGEIGTREYIPKIGDPKNTSEVKKSITEIRVLRINQLDRPNRTAGQGDAA